MPPLKYGKSFSTVQKSKLSEEHNDLNDKLYYI